LSDKAPTTTAFFSDTPVASSTALSGDVSFWIAAWSHDYAFGDAPVKVAIDNFIINSGELVCSQSSSLEIIDARMISPNELGIGVSAKFPVESDYKKRIIIFDAEINGVPVKKEIDVTGYTIPGEEWGKQSYYYPMFDPQVIWPYIPH